MFKIVLLSLSMLGATWPDPRGDMVGVPASGGVDIQAFAGGAGTYTWNNRPVLKSSASSSSVLAVVVVVVVARTCTEVAVALPGSWGSGQIHCF